MKTILDNEFATVNVHPDKKILQHKFHKFIFGDAFREVLTKGVDAFEENHCTKWLSDDRNNSALKQEDLTWTQTIWEPRVLKAGWKYWALVMPDKTVGKMSMKGLVDHYAKVGVTVEIFDSPEKGMAWLESK